MSSHERAERGVLAALVAFALFGAVAHLLLAVDVRVPAPLLPVAAITGCLVAWRARIDPSPATDPAPRWVAWPSAILVGIATGAIAYGALATPSRHWDGAVAWDLRSEWLTSDATLAQPFFADPAVLSPARDYPLLQPLLVAAGNTLFGGQAGRALFPVVFALLALMLGTAVRRATGSATIGWLAAGAAVLTPALANPTSGGADSGYGDALLLANTTAIAAGVATRDGRLVFLGALLAVFTKPEGLPYAAAATTVAAIVGDRGALRAAGGGLAIGGALWLPLQQRLAVGAPSSSWLASAPLLFWLGLEAFDAIARRWSLGAAARALVAGVVAAAAVAIVWSCREMLGGTMRAYCASAADPFGHLGRLPTIVASACNYAFLRGNFGLAYSAALLAVMTALRRGTLLPLRGLLVFVATGLGLTIVPFLLSPEADLGHHLRSSMPRLLLHWLGPALVLGAAGLGAATTPTTRPRTSAAAP